MFCVLFVMRMYVCLLFLFLVSVFLCAGVVEVLVCLCFVCVGCFACRVLCLLRECLFCLVFLIIIG